MGATWPKAVSALTVTDSGHGALNLDAATGRGAPIVTRLALGVARCPNNRRTTRRHRNDERRCETDQEKLERAKSVVRAIFIAAGQQRRRPVPPTPTSPS